jgi:hypothetical protein
MSNEIQPQDLERIQEIFLKQLDLLTKVVELVGKTEKKAEEAGLGECKRTLSQVHKSQSEFKEKMTKKEVPIVSKRVETVKKQARVIKKAQTEPSPEKTLAGAPTATVPLQPPVNSAVVPDAQSEKCLEEIKKVKSALDNWDHLHNINKGGAGGGWLFWHYDKKSAKVMQELIDALNKLHATRHPLLATQKYLPLTSNMPALTYLHQFWSGTTDRKEPVLRLNHDEFIALFRRILWALDQDIQQMKK